MLDAETTGGLGFAWLLLPSQNLGRGLCCVGGTTKGQGEGEVQSVELENQKTGR